MLLLLRAAARSSRRRRRRRRGRASRTRRARRRIQRRIRDASCAVALLLLIVLLLHLLVARPGSLLLRTGRAVLLSLALASGGVRASVVRADGRVVETERGLKGVRVVRGDLRERVTERGQFRLESGERSADSRSRRRRREIRAEQHQRAQVGDSRRC